MSNTEMEQSVEKPQAGSSVELAIFQALQARLPALFRDIFPDPSASRTVVIIPSLSLDQDVLARLTGAHHYEERLLCMLMLLKLPRTRIIYVTSQPLPEEIIDYYLHLLPGIPAAHARRRLTLLSCFDASAQPLAAKILARPRLIARLRDAIADSATAHMSCFNVSPLERALAVKLGVPIYGCDPSLLPLGSKSGGRTILREAGVPIPEGVEGVADAHDLVAALGGLKRRNPALRRAVVKLNEGFSGEGNAIFSFEGAPERSGLEAWIKSRLPALSFEARGMSWEAFSAKIEEMGAIAEEFIEGAIRRSPSAQYRIDPLGQIDAISTHDQVLGGRSDQIFLGCRFPADESYRLEIQNEGLKAAHILRDRGVLGRFGIDFLSVWDGSAWRHHAIEINLRKGGTTHPFMMLQFLTDGRYDSLRGEFTLPSGASRCYYASDNLEAPIYRGLTPADLLDIAALNGLHFNRATQQGVVFHLIGALSEFGKVGIVCVAPSRDEADRLYRDVIAVLDREQAAAHA
ncbi:peptide ligase PGM1-related protein [Methylocapsa acidiphila]|uniref:peptide ligase PGM1-related protein n=1 Tax=Methylocapsa acidiphila TaxID=133552 RepID=UPI000403D3CA|nr:peptide ligase PGM1-related protein [Methylocapsa acidiphila]